MRCFYCRTKTWDYHRRRGSSTIGAKSLSRLVDSIGFDEFDKSGISPEKSSTNKFTLCQLAEASGNFVESNLIGEGGFGRVYKGRLESGQMVAIKQLNRKGQQGTQEFLMECLMLMMLHHPNLVRLIGYCAEGEERVLVYEYMSNGSLEDHLFNLPPNKYPLDWNTRVKIALGAARGLTYLHELVNAPVIYRDLKSSNILLDGDFNPKLSDFGLAKLGPTGDKTHVSTRVMGTMGYAAPDYVKSGKLNVKSDVYSFGVVLLELVTGRMALDFSKDKKEQELINWSRPFMRDKEKYFHLADPLLRGCYNHRGFYQLVVVISYCLNERAYMRPSMTDVTDALVHVASQPYIPNPNPKPNSNGGNGLDREHNHKDD